MYESSQESKLQTRKPRSKSSRLKFIEKIRRCELLLVKVSQLPNGRILFQILHHKTPVSFVTTTMKNAHHGDCEMPKPKSIIHQISRLACKVSPLHHSVKKDTELGEHSANLSNGIHDLDFKSVSRYRSHRDLDIPRTIEFQTAEDTEIRRLLSFEVKNDVVL